MQPHSPQLKFTPKRALINLASCAFSAVYNNNRAANRAQPSMRTHSCTSQRGNFRGSAQPAHSQTSVCAALKANQSLAPRQDAEELDSICMCLSDPPGRISDCEQQRGNNRLSSSRPTLKWAKLVVARSSYRLHV